MKAMPVSSKIIGWCAALAACAGFTAIAEDAAQTAAEAAAANEASLVSCDMGDPGLTSYNVSQWSQGTAEILADDSKPAELEVVPGSHAARIKMTFTKWTLQGLLIDIDRPIPGNPKYFTLWHRWANKPFNEERPDIGQPGWDFIVLNNEGKEVTLPRKHVAGGNPNKGEWEQVRCEVPEEGGPFKLRMFKFNNWYIRGQPSNQVCTIDFRDVRVYTDLSDTPQEQRPWSLNVTFPAQANVFYWGEQKPAFQVSAQSWIGDERKVKVSAKVVAAVPDGDKPREWNVPVPDFLVRDVAFASVDMPDLPPGAYNLIVSATGFPEKKEFKHRFVIARHPPTLTEDQKIRSTYGINVHGGNFVGYPNFSRLGFVWLRDYAFNFNWMVNAKGDGLYAGWPWYPKILAAAEAEGMLTLPCMMGGIQVNPNESDPEKRGSLTPTSAWRRNMGHIFCSLGDRLHAFELDNEKEGVHWTYPDAYAAYHQAFGDVLKAVLPDAWAVAEGCAGIDVEGDRQRVLDGTYRNIDVLNGHRYCGIEAPEYSKSNANTGMGEAKKTYLRDVWRHWKAAGRADGKERQCWVTEWGFDNLAGQIVTEWEQASYMQRKWVLSMGNGIDKMFWYWFYDSDTDNPRNFFDGCGIYDRFREPKPVAAAFAALRTFLPADYEYVGYANIDDNNMAHILKCGGRYVAMAFKIRKDRPGADVSDQKAMAVYDMFGAIIGDDNAIAQKKAEVPYKTSVDSRFKGKLGIAPTWFIGLDPNSQWIKQAAMDLDSDFFVRNVGGEPIKVHVKDGDKYKYTVQPPQGWTVEEKEYGFDVTGPEGLDRGNTRFTVTGMNGDAKQVMPVEVDIVPQAYAKSYAAGFDGAFKVEIVNQSEESQVFTVRANLPEGWTVDPAAQNTRELQPDEKATLNFMLKDSRAIPATEKVAIPKLEIMNRKGLLIDYVPVIPRAWEMRRIDGDKLAFDGDLSEWDEKHRLPAWMLGPHGDKEGTKVYFAYDNNGIYIAFDVDDSQCSTSDPRAFWRAADCLEFQFSAPGAKFVEGANWTPNDHQFWFCPLANENRVFAGFWPNCEGQDMGEDLQDVKNGLKKTDRGYVMELFVPASRIHGWNPKQGEMVGMAFTLAVKGHRDPREVYWPASKADNAVKRPWMWSRVKLGD